MNYKEFNDYELLDYVYSCNEDATEILLYKYKPLVISLASKMITYCHGGVDLNDLIQEGMMGLNEAIIYYDDSKDANFGTFAKICIERKIYSLVKSTRRYKNKILNESISFEYDGEDVTADKFLMDNRTNPLEMITDIEWEKETLLKLDKELTDLEKQVFELKKNHFSYKEIAEILEKSPKAIDNAIQRIKIKLKNIMKED